MRDPGDSEKREASMGISDLELAKRSLGAAVRTMKSQRKMIRTLGGWLEKYGCHLATCHGGESKEPCICAWGLVLDAVLGLRQTEEPKGDDDMIGVADAEACGIPFKELSTFRDYVRNNYEGDLTTLPPEIKYGIIHSFAKEFIQAKEERLKKRQIEMRQLREVGTEDRERELERHRAGQPDQTLDDVADQGEEQAENTAPSPLPDSSSSRRRRRRRRGKSARP